MAIFANQMFSAQRISVAMQSVQERQGVACLETASQGLETRDMMTPFLQSEDKATYALRAFFCLV